MTVENPVEKKINNTNTKSKIMQFASILIKKR